jgi:pilus assembly protein CpaB
LKRRILAVAVAALLAALGAVAVLAYVHQANNRAVQGIRAETVMVAKSTIQPGTKVGQAIDQGLLTTQKFPSESLPADPVYSLSASQRGLVINSALQPGNILLRSNLVSSAQYTGSSISGLAIPSGQMAVTIQVCLSADVAGYVQPGAWVAVFNTAGRDAPLEFTCSSHQPPSKGPTITQLVLTNVKVLAVSAAPASAGGTGTGASAGLAAADPVSAASSVTNQGQVLVTIAVTKAEAERLILVGDAGEPTFGLLAAGYVPPPDIGVGISSP